MENTGKTIQITLAKNSKCWALHPTTGLCTRLLGLAPDYWALHPTTGLSSEYWALHPTTGLSSEYQVYDPNPKKLTQFRTAYFDMSIPNEFPLVMAYLGLDHFRNIF